MNELERHALLFDYYGELLTEQQRKIYEEVFFDDYSISEVARDEGITRQGVHDMIKRTEKLLEEYEKKLGLVEIHKKVKEIAERIDEIITDNNFSTEIKKLTGELKEI